MIFLSIRVIVLGIAGFVVYKVASTYLSDTKTCPRCKGKGSWQGNRVRETCDWCNGSGKLPKDYPV